MAGRVQWEAQVDSNVAKLLSETKELRDQLDGIKKGNYEIKLNIDDKKLEKVISNLDKMLESLGKGTGDFKEFENLSKQLNKIVSEVKELNKVFSGINDSGVSNLLSSIQSIDKSLSSLSEHITNVNKDFGSVGKNASDNVSQINEARKATEGLAEATKELANAQKNVGNKSNISSSIKDTFQGDVKASSESSTPDIKDEAKAMEQVAENAEKASKGKNEFAKANKKVKESATASVNAVNEEKISLSSMQKEIDKYNKNYKDFNRKPTNANRSNNYQSALNNYKNSIEELQKFYNTLDNSTPITSEQLSKWKELTTNVDIASDALKSFSAAEKGSTEAGRWKEIDKISKYLDKNTKISKEARQQLQGYLDLLKSGSVVNIEEIHMQFNKIAEAERRAGREGKSFFDILTNKSIYGLAARFASYYLSFMDFIRYARNGINAIKELDTALVDLRKTTTMNTNQLEDFYYASNDVAKQMGVTTSEIINQASAWSRLGYSSKEAATEMAALSSQFASISPGMDLDTSTDGLVSTMKAFDIEVEDVERKIMDNINRIGNTAATSNDEIVDMLTRSSAAMAVANNTLEETIALETAAVEITRNAESTGTAFKTISMRIRGRQTLPPYTVMYMLCA